jgi:hypothetical protein
MKGLWALALWIVRVDTQMAIHGAGTQMLYGHGHIWGHVHRPCFHFNFFRKSADCSTVQMCIYIVLSVSLSRERH